MSPIRAVAGFAIVLAAMLVVSPAIIAAPDDGRAATPPMGWNSWNKFGCDVSESLIREMADAMVTSGMQRAGYQYIVIDDCWQVDRTGDGQIVPDPQRFPNGMRPLGDYIHARGLKFGLYSDVGTKTCQGRPGSHGYEREDATAYASWGVDYVKYDWCASEGIDAKVSYTRMRDALDATGRSIVFSMCEWGVSKPWLWARGVGHLWRTTDDILDCWDCKDEYNSMGFTKLLDINEPYARYAGPGGWNDPDMLEVGNGGMTAAEYRAHFSLWALMAAPLMAGNDLRSMSDDTKAILTNADVIAIDQDKLGRQGSRVRDDGDVEVWTKPLFDGGSAVILFNRSGSSHAIHASWSEIGLAKPPSQVRDLWTHQSVAPNADGLTVTVPSHDVLLVRVAP